MSQGVEVGLITIPTRVFVQKKTSGVGDLAATMLGVILSVNCQCTGITWKVGQHYVLKRTYMSYYVK